MKSYGQIVKDYKKCLAESQEQGEEKEVELKKLKQKLQSTDPVDKMICTDPQKATNLDQCLWGKPPSKNGTPQNGNKNNGRPHKPDNVKKKYNSRGMSNQVTMQK